MRLRFGLATGEVVGTREVARGEFLVTGDAVNVAARLQTLAEPGQVVIGGATRDAAGDAIRVRPLGELSVKGRQAPVRAFVVVS